MHATVFRLPWITIVILALSCPGIGQAEVQVGTSAQTHRFLRQAPLPSTREVRLSAARDEYKGFQVLVRSDKPCCIENLLCSDLNGPGPAKIPCENLLSRYRQHQIQITVPTYRNRDFQPGWYPDGLIPFMFQPLKNAKLAAVPFDLPAEETHGFWIDVHVPADAPAGEYKGTCGISIAQAKAIEIPITLTVWDFALPRVPTLFTEFGSPAHGLRAFYRLRAGKEPEPADWAAVEEQCADLMARHRLNVPPPGKLLTLQAGKDGSYVLPAEQIKALAEYVDRYHLNAIRVPNPKGIVKDPEKEKTKLHAWLKAWDHVAAQLNRPGFLFYTYLWDEPNDEKAYQGCRTWGKAIREAKSVVKVLIVEQTWTQDPAWGDLYGAVDIWCPLFCLHKQDSAEKRMALGEMVWTYTALCQCKEPTPWWHTDYPLLNYRVPTWMAWNSGMRGLLYWELAFWRKVADPWTEPKTYESGKAIFNGEGSLTYPARPVGYEGLVPSLRLKALRDSIDDYEYLVLAEKAKGREEVRKVVQPLTSSFFNWEKDPAAYERARAKLAELITAKRKMMNGER